MMGLLKHALSVRKKNLAILSHVMEVVEARLSSHPLLHTFKYSSPAHRLTVHRRFCCSRICDDVSGILKKKNTFSENGSINQFYNNKSWNS